LIIERDVCGNYSWKWELPILLLNFEQICHKVSEEPNFAGHATLFSTMERALGQVHSLGGRVL
jgi:hypothetical protein